jgi:hypothetical protein
MCVTFTKLNSQGRDVRPSTEFCPDRQKPEASRRRILKANSMKILSLPTTHNDGPLVTCHACGGSRYWIACDAPEQPALCLHCDSPIRTLNGRKTEIEVFELPTETMPDGAWSPEWKRNMLMTLRTGNRNASKH